MTDDLVHKLRAWSGMISDFYNASMMEKAADRIFKLEAENARLREALVDASNFVKDELETRIDSHTVGGDMSTLDEMDGGSVGEAMDCLARINASLGDTP